MEYPGSDPFSSFGDQLSRRLLETRTIVVNEAITPSAAARLTEQFTLLDAESAGPIQCLMNSVPGGDDAAALSLYDLMRSLTAPLTVLGGGRIAGAGVVAYLGAPAARRCALPHVRFQFEPVRDPTDQGPDAPPESRLEAIRDRRARIVGLIAAATGRPEAEVAADLSGHRSFDAAEAVAYGLVDRIVRSRDDLA
jgi:ATP-dependent Clp protease protease subunit